MPSFIFFFFNDTATTEIYTLSLHDALPICEFMKIEKIKHIVINLKKEKERKKARQLKKILGARSEEHTSELQSPDHLVCRLLLEKKKKNTYINTTQRIMSRCPAELTTHRRR